MSMRVSMRVDTLLCSLNAGASRASSKYRDEVLGFLQRVAPPLIVSIQQVCHH